MTDQRSVDQMRAEERRRITRERAMSDEALATAALTTIDDLDSAWSLRSISITDARARVEAEAQVRALRGDATSPIKRDVGGCKVAIEGGSLAQGVWPEESLGQVLRERFVHAECEPLVDALPCLGCDLPPELLVDILAFVETRDLCAVSETCRFFYLLSSDDILWRSRATRRDSSLVQFLPEPDRSRLAFKDLVRFDSRVQRNWRLGKCDTRVLKGHEGAVRCVKFDERRLISASRDQTLIVWDWEGHKRQVLRGHTEPVYCFAYDENRIVSGSRDKSMRVWSHDGELVSTVEAHDHSVLSLDFDGERVVTGSADSTIKVWSVDAERCVETLDAHTDWVSCLQLDGNTATSGSVDEWIKVWDLRTNKCTQKVQSVATIYCLQRDEHHVYCGLYDNTVRAYDLRTGRQLHRYVGHKGWVFGLKFDSHKLVSGSFDNKVKIWDRNTTECLSTLDGHAGFVVCLDFHTNLMASGSMDRTIRLWDFQHRGARGGRGESKGKSGCCVS